MTLPEAIDARSFRAEASCRGFVRATSLRRALRAAAIEADEVIDVGVHAGTPGLYAALKGARFILVDPLPGAETLVRHPPAGAVFVNKALGAQAGELDLQVTAGGATSGFAKRTALTARETVDRVRVEVTTLDALICETCDSARIGIKIDTEGHELDVLRGLVTECPRVAFVIAEVSVKRRFENGYTFSDLVAHLNDKGFVLYNILNPTTPKAPRYLDVLFLPANDPRFDT